MNYNKFGQTGNADGGTMSVDEKLKIITRDLAETCKEEIMKKVLVEEKRDVKIYWGTATTGKPHIGYFVPMLKIADFLRAGCEVTILFADIHGYLDNMKSSFELLAYRTEYYKAIISALLESVGVSLDKLTFRTGREFQLTPAYTLDLLRLTTMCSQDQAKKAGAEVVKQSDSPPLSGLLYPLLQWLDEEYLDCDAQFGGVDQRKIFMGAERYMPKIGYKQRAHLMNPMVTGMQGTKMSSSEANSKLDLIDTPTDVKKKIKKVFCEEKNIENNPLLEYVKAVILKATPEFVITKWDKTSTTYTDHATLLKDFAEGRVHPADLKDACTNAFNNLLAPIRKKFETPELVKLTELAYPAPVVETKAPKPTAAPGEKKEKVKKAAPLPKESDGGEVKNDISRILIKVGKIVSVEKHPGADSMYVEKIDLGEAELRTVVSGLVGKVDIEALQNRVVLCVCNLKPANLRSIKSEAMLLCATSEDGKTECLDPPAGVVVGERVFVEGFEGDADAVIKPGSSKKGPSIWETVQPDLATTDGCVATYKGSPIMTSKGPVTVSSAKSSVIR
eukprot:m.257445 g.257445  ORF g.257445 m.257445 type:complete len:561 (-) comp35310_c0_seq1:133-1815(-)